MKGKNQLTAINEESDSISNEDFVDIENELNDIQELLDRDREDDDNRNKVLEKLRKALKRVDKLESDTEWPKIKEELEDALKRLDELNKEFGNEKTKDVENQLKKQAEQVISNKDSKIAD